MGLSIAISGGIILVTFMVVLYNIPGMLDIILSVADVSSEVFDLEESILETNVLIDSLAATSGSPTLTFNLNNVGNEKLWNYDEFDLIITYDADISGTKTKVTETIPFGLPYWNLNEVVSTSTDNTATGSYTVINDMTKTVTVAGTSSHILFHANITYDSDGADASCRTALFIDGSMVAEAQDTVDHNTVEPGNIGLTWWETDLSAGPHTFDVRWLEQQTDCILATDTERSMQVIEFTAADGNPTILSEQTSTSLQDMTTSYVDISGLTDTVTIDSTSSIVLFTATVTFDAFDSDAEGDAALFIDGVNVAEGRTFIDSDTNEPGHVNLHWWDTGLSAGLHDFDVRGKEGFKGAGFGEAETDTATQRHMQVVEFTGAGVPTILTEVTSSSGQSYTATYQLVSGMAGSPTIASSDSLVFTTGTVSFDEDGGGDASCFLGIFIDSTLQAEQQTFTDEDVEGTSAGVMWTKKGLSAGSHDFELQAKEGQTGCGTDTAMQRHMQVVEFPRPICDKQWNIVSITNDVFDPGMLNTDETAQILVTLCNSIFSNGNVIVSMVTDNGVVTTSALTVT